MLQIKAIDLNEIYILYHVPIFVYVSSYFYVRILKLFNDAMKYA